MHFACYIEAQFPIEPILKELEENNIQFDIKDHEGRKALWLADINMIGPVNQAYVDYQQRLKQQKQHTLTADNVKQLPVTVMLIGVSLLVALVTQLGEQFNEYFYIAQMQYFPRGWIPYSGVEAVWHGITPIFLHFGVEHLVFNSLSCWYMGSILERKMPLFMYLVLVVLLALISNYCQLWVTGPLFGGLSGVVYGLIGFALCYQVFIQPLMIPKGLFYLAIGWLILGYTPLFEVVGLGSMANAAHLSGLLGGIVLFFIYFIVLKKSRYGY